MICKWNVTTCNQSNIQTTNNILFQTKMWNPWGHRTSWIFLTRHIHPVLRCHIAQQIWQGLHPAQHCATTRENEVPSPKYIYMNIYNCSLFKLNRWEQKNNNLFSKETMLATLNNTSSKVTLWRRRISHCEHKGQFTRNLTRPLNT